MIHIMSNYYLCYARKRIRFFWSWINLGKHFVFVWLELGEYKEVMGFCISKEEKKNGKWDKTEVVCVGRRSFGFMGEFRLPPCSLTSVYLALSFEFSERFSKKSLVKYSV